MTTQQNQHWLKGERGFGLLWVYFVTVILGLSSLALYNLALWQTKTQVIELNREKAFYYAEAALDQKLQELRLGNVADIALSNIGQGSYAAVYDAGEKTITATGTTNGATRTIVAKIKKTIPPGVRGAISGNGDMSTNGGIVVDGRDHDTNGNVIGNGTYGLATSGSYSQSGSSQVGGNGVAPADPAEPGTVEEDGPGVATTPEEALGLAPGALDAYKTTTTPTLPMNNQIVYMTDNEGSNEWIAPDFGTAENPSTGILIFHNESGTAKLKNLKGYFHGIIITDDIEHINNNVEILGAVIVMANDKNIGNGNAYVKYSSIAIGNTPLAANYSIISWEDMLN
ncbi:MAG: hypothetical protein COV74_04210 [Candidatus Omnitrophica bacterium CG11_big_fil_rev_8_21_14_0_20_45_26]|uniref:Type 4 fimbrial biogenesis protein PilX N-terminal domain-containing protein n=1 Tax=Candidatus Abzuiibacterium crystallinum TaxID=1974748 RepID=A0A2H0LQD1_9BACT|nr:MAG: hypothetical protein COV74_04210 [Candidatus Omnitrophica bacterium CG11_big_fil_rev_8_21_14_0_20_45_26]PIW63984.1 MAG: hypothetical protein COW12_08770 [Candidatus Omnitrophica bacterium CG12_big_fil_rev_8_21_14_0_65_45_16]